MKILILARTRPCAPQIAARYGIPAAYWTFLDHDRQIRGHHQKHKVIVEEAVRTDTEPSFILRQILFCLERLNADIIEVRCPSADQADEFAKYGAVRHTHIAGIPEEPNPEAIDWLFDYIRMREASRQ